MSWGAISSLIASDSSPKNKHWTRYAALFSPAEVNLMERQLLFLLDYDLRMDEAELLQHFSPFLRRPVASTSSYRPRTDVKTEHSLDYPTTPRRPSAVKTSCPVPDGILTPGPSPTRAAHDMSAPSSRRPSAPPTRVSPAGSSSSGGETLSDDLDSGDEDMNVDLRSRPSTTPKYVGPASLPSYRRSSLKVGSGGPVTPTDELQGYALPMPMPDSGSRRGSYGDREPQLRTQRSGSFLRLMEAGKDIFRSNKPIATRPGVQVVEMVVS